MGGGGGGENTRVFIRVNTKASRRKIKANRMVKYINIRRKLFGQILWLTRVLNESEVYASLKSTLHSRDENIFFH